MSGQAIEKWWATNQEPEESEGARFERAMDRFVEDTSDRPALPAYLDWLRRTALAPELYFEWLCADPDSLEPLFMAFEAGWSARKGEAVGYATGID